MDNHITKAQQAGIQALNRLRANGVIPKPKPNAAPKLRFVDLPDDQKWQFVIQKLRELDQPVNQFINDNENLIREKETKELREELATERKKRKALEELCEDMQRQINILKNQIVSTNQAMAMIASASSG